MFRNLGMNNIVSIKTPTREFTRCYDGVDHVDDTSEKLKTCYTGTVALIEANETVTVHNLYGHEIHTESVSNFFGLIKLSDIPWWIDINALLLTPNSCNLFVPNVINFIIHDLLRSAIPQSQHKHLKFFLLSSTEQKKPCFS